MADDADDRDATDGTTDGAPTHRRGRIVAVAVAAVVLLAVGAGLLMLFGGERATSTSEDEALDRFRTEGTAGGATTEGTTDDTGASFERPEPGVYAYTGSGEEVTSFPPLTEQEGPEMPASVTLGDAGCWTFRIDYNTHHWQDWTFCITDEGVVDTGGQSFARRDFVTFQIDNTATFTCDPAEPMLWPDMAPGESRRGTCAGTSTNVEGTAVTDGTMTMVGTEVLTIGGEEVEAVHVHREHVLTGAQTGTERLDWWLHPRTGLPLRNERSIAVDTDTPVGAVSYTEEASFELTSLTPRT